MRTQAVNLTRSLLQEFDKAHAHSYASSHNYSHVWVFFLPVNVRKLPKSSNSGQTRRTDTPKDRKLTDRLQLASMAAGNGADVQGALM